METELPTNEAPYLDPEAERKFMQELERQSRIALIGDPSIARIDADLSRRIHELRYFARMNKASKAQFWRCRYGLPMNLYGAAPVLAPVEYPATAALVLMKEAADAGELRVPISDKTHRKNNPKLSAHQKTKIMRAARGEWDVASPDDNYFKQGAAHWKPDVDSNLIYSPTYGHTHGITPWRSLALHDLLGPELKFEVLVNNLIDTAFENLGAAAEGRSFLEIALSNMGCENVSKKSLAARFSTKRRNATTHRVFFTLGDLQAMHADSPENFYELLARLARLLHSVAQHLTFRMQPVAMRVDHTVAFALRRYLLFTWKRFSDLFSICAMQPQHYIFLASFDPYFTPADKFVRCDKARFYLTNSELRDLCSAQELKRWEFKAPPARTRRVVNQETRTITTIKIPTPEPRKGYFIGRKFPTLVIDEETEPVRAAYSKWLRDNYLPDLIPKSSLGVRTIKFEAPIQAPISKQDSANHEALFYHLCEEFKEYVGETPELRRAFKKWLSDPMAPAKPSSAHVITLARLASMSFDEQEALAMSFFGYRSSGYFEENSEAFLSNMQAAIKNQ